MTAQLSAEILHTDSPELFQAAVARAVELLRAGEVVALPTETVYGLAANATDAEAVSKIFEIKGRPAHNPIIVHVASIEMAKRCVAHWPQIAGKLAKSFWPGPLTMVLQRAVGVSPTGFRQPDAGGTFHIPDILTAGGETVGIRWPSHPFIQAVIRECDFPLAAPSANPSNRVSPTTAEHVSRGLGEKIRLIVDGGRSNVGIESTVLDLTSRPARVLRPGMIHAESLAAVVGDVQNPASNIEHPTSDIQHRTLRSPGLLKRHYAPRARMLVLNWTDEADLRRQLETRKLNLEAVQIIAHSRVPAVGEFGGVSVIPHDPEAFARALYAELHQCDDACAEVIVVEAPPDTSDWRAIKDRLDRAAAT